MMDRYQCIAGTCRIRLQLLPNHKNCMPDDSNAERNEQPASQHTCTPAHVEFLLSRSSIKLSPGRYRPYSHSPARAAPQCTNPSGRRQITSRWFRDTFSLSRHENRVSDTFMDSKRLNYKYTAIVSIWQIESDLHNQGTPTYSVFCPDESQFKL